MHKGVQFHLTMFCPHSEIKTCLQVDKKTCLNLKNLFSYKSVIKQARLNSKPKLTIF